MRTAIVWFRRDLRVADHPALRAARGCDRLIPVYIHGPDEDAPWAAGAASRWWLHHSLSALQHALGRRGSRLLIRKGPATEALLQLAREADATALFWSGDLPEPAARRQAAQVRSALQVAGISCHEFGGYLLHIPEALRTRGGQPFRVFTPFWKALQQSAPPSDPQPAPRALPPVPGQLHSLPLAALELLPRIRWDSGLAASWRPGEPGARKRLAEFAATALADYPEGRDHPAETGTSRLSPHLHFGEITPRQILHVVDREVAMSPSLLRGAEAFTRQLGWREFGAYLLHHFPHTPEAPLDRRFEQFRWRHDYAPLYDAWRHGATGYPIVDAGLRELWHTGWMHNRVRLLAASLLVKNLRVPWQEGARWFWDTLVDADLGNNTLGWQWVAGCGADAAPFFRVFNPVLQAQRHDPQGRYVRRWLPELAGLPDRWLARPWAAPATVLASAGVVLGRDYPQPVVPFAPSRQEALDAWHQSVRSPRVHGPG